MADFPAPFPPKMTVNGDGAANGALSHTGIADGDSAGANGPLPHTGIAVEGEDSAVSSRPHPGQMSTLSLSIQNKSTCQRFHEGGTRQPSIQEHQRYHEGGTR